MTKFLTQFNYDKEKPKDTGKQAFDEKVTFRMKGKDIVIKDYVQENAVGTTFYENLELYGNIESTAQAMAVYREELIGDFTEATSLVDLEQRRIRIKQIWENLPAEIRSKKFGNNFQNFMNNGNKFIDEQQQILNMEIAKNERQAEIYNTVKNEETAQPKEPVTTTETK